jgi:hypothetical protein
MDRRMVEQKPITIIDEAILIGGVPNVSNAFTINGQPRTMYLDVGHLHR